MDFRRIPFQFSTTDASKRQEELQRRFGLPANKGNMYVDFENSGAMGTRPDNSSASNSPRLQHRVPIFVEGMSEPTKPSVDAQNVDSGRKPHVRVVPIEIVGQDSASKRHRWLSGSSDPGRERVNGIPVYPVSGTTIPVYPVRTIPVYPVSSTTIPVYPVHPVNGINIPVEYPVKAPSPQAPKTPRVCNIPIKIEGSADVIQPKLPVKTQKAEVSASPKNTGVNLNGLSSSNVTKVGEKKESPTANVKKPSGIEEKTLKKIEDILEKLKGYHSDVEKFSGTNKEKSYRYLDEMLTRCMLELDEIDTLGLDTIRLARKAAVKKVQASVDLLELKVIKEKGQDQISKEPMEIELAADLPSEADGKKTDFDQSANKSSERMNVEVTEPVQITGVETGADVATSEVEPIVEEPSSDSKDENVDMDLSSCDSDLTLETPSVKISEVENNAFFDTNNSEDINLEMEMAEASDIPIVSEQTVLSSNNIPSIVDVEPSVAEQTVISSDSNECTNVSDSNIVTNS